MSRIMMLFLALLLAGAVASVAPSATNRAAVACAPSSNDVVCRAAATLTVAGTTINDGIGRLVASGSRAVTNTKGIASIYFRRRAICQMTTTAASLGTSLRTRYPYSWALFRQSRGKTTCTLTPGSPVTIIGSGTLAPAYREAPLADEPFSALVEVSSRVPAQFRTAYDPDTSCTIGVYRGALTVRLSNEQIVRLAAGNELIVTIGPGGSIASTKVGAGTFSAADKSVWSRQLKQLS